MVPYVVELEPAVRQQAPSQHQLSFILCFPNQDGAIRADLEMAGSILSRGPEDHEVRPVPLKEDLPPRRHRVGSRALRYDEPGAVDRSRLAPDVTHAEPRDAPTREQEHGEGGNPRQERVRTYLRKHR